MKGYYQILETGSLILRDEAYSKSYYYDLHFQVFSRAYTLKHRKNYTYIRSHGWHSVQQIVRTLKVHPFLGLISIYDIKV